jgi:hypothetical protein
METTQVRRVQANDRYYLPNLCRLVNPYCLRRKGTESTTTDDEGQMSLE